MPKKRAKKNETVSPVAPKVSFTDIISQVEQKELGSIARSTGNAASSPSEIAGRKSGRNAALAYLDKPDLKKLLTKILANDKETVVLKIKNHLLADINTLVFDAILAALWKNTACQALYIQNLSSAIHEKQLVELVELLKAKQTIWCINIGEIYEIPLSHWEMFCAALPETAVTHLYVSEHIIPIELKNKMRLYIRENRQKHSLHCSTRNLSVIERCTNMWWNPINGVKFPKPKGFETDNKFDVKYWQQGVGEGGDQPWKFSCVCGEKCSSYENHRYHPTGRMFECSNCNLWSHVNCVLGNHFTDEDLEELTDIMCASCTAKQKRTQRYSRSDENREYLAAATEVVSGKTLLQQTNDKKRKIESEAGAGVEVQQEKEEVKEEEQKQEEERRRKPELLLFYVNNGASSSTTSHGTRVVESTEKGDGDGDDDNDEYEPEVEVTTPWKFKCKCGISCSSEDNPPYYPDGNTFECCECGLWCHVACVLGTTVTAEDLEVMENVKCIACARKSKKPRNRRKSDPSGENVVKVDAIKESEEGFGDVQGTVTDDGAPLLSVVRLPTEKMEETQDEISVSENLK